MTREVDEESFRKGDKNQVQEKREIVQTAPMIHREERVRKKYGVHPRRPTSGNASHVEGKKKQRSAKGQEECTQTPVEKRELKH